MNDMTRFSHLAMFLACAMTVTLIRPEPLY